MELLRLIHFSNFPFLQNFFVVNVRCNSSPMSYNLLMDRSASRIHANSVEFLVQFKISEYIQFWENLPIHSQASLSMVYDLPISLND